MRSKNSSTIYSLQPVQQCNFQSAVYTSSTSTIYTLVQSTIYIFYTAAQSSGTTSTFFKMNDKSKLIKHVREAPTNFCSSSFFSYISQCLLVPGLVIFTIYIKSSITVYSSFLKFIHQSYLSTIYRSLIIQICAVLSSKQFLAVIDYISSVHNP